MILIYFIESKRCVFFFFLGSLPINFTPDISTLDMFLTFISHRVPKYVPNKGLMKSCSRLHRNRRGKCYLEFIVFVYAFNHKS